MTFHAFELEEVNVTLLNSITDFFDNILHTFYMMHERLKSFTVYEENIFMRSSANYSSCGRVNSKE